MATDDPKGVHEPESAFAAPWSGDGAARPTRHIVLELDEDAAGLLDELMARGHRDVSDLVGWALGAYWRELDGVVLPRQPEQDPDALMTEAIADIGAGRTIPHEEVMAAARKIVGR